jgi:hypothetical protein
MFEKRSTTTMICVWPSNSGRATMKSTKVNSQGEYDNSKSCSSLNFACLVDFISWHISQVCTYSLIYSSIFGSRNFSWWVPAFSFILIVLPLCCRVCFQWSPI